MPERGQPYVFREAPVRIFAVRLALGWGLFQKDAGQDPELIEEFDSWEVCYRQGAELSDRWHYQREM
jgi:hypothetical protein